MENLNELSTTTCVYVSGGNVACVSTLTNGYNVIMTYGFWDFISLLTCIFLGLLTYKIYKIN